MRDLVLVVIGGVSTMTLGSYVDEMNVTDCKEYAKKTHQQPWLSDHESLIDNEDYRESYKLCLREFL